MTEGRPADRRSGAFLLIFALANAGGVIAYLPLLTLLLPIRVESLAGDARIGVFTATVVAGAIAASAANILFGWLSDRSVAHGGGRRRWMAGGVVATALSYAAAASAHSATGAILAIVAFQIAVNALLAPMLAIMADEIPDAQKGIAGGLLALGAPVASGFGAALVGIGGLSEPARFAIVPLAFALCALPLLLTRARPAATVAPIVTASAAGTTREAMPPRGDLLLAWSARLLVQIAGNVLSLYLLYYFESVAADWPHDLLVAHVGHLLAVAFVIPLPIAIGLGRLSDRIDRRKPFLAGTAVFAASGLLAMALSRGWQVAAVGFGMYTVGSAVFLALHSAYSMQLLPDPRRRGRDLGLLNLTNTLPSLIGPALAWSLATPRDFHGLMLMLSALTLSGGGVILAVRSRR